MLCSHGTVDGVVSSVNVLSLCERKRESTIKFLPVEHCCELIFGWMLLKTALLRNTKPGWLVLEFNWAVWFDWSCLMLTPGWHTWQKWAKRRIWQSATEETNIVYHQDDWVCVCDRENRDSGRTVAVAVAVLIKRAQCSRTLTLIHAAAPPCMDWTLSCMCSPEKWILTHPLVQPHNICRAASDDNNRPFKALSAW